jgi:hypothetical protein
MRYFLFTAFGPVASLNDWCKCLHNQGNDTLVTHCNSILKSLEVKNQSASPRWKSTLSLMTSVIHISTGLNSQRWGTACTLPHYLLCVLSCVLFVLYCVLFVCKYVLPPGDNPIAVNKYNISHQTKPPTSDIILSKRVTVTPAAIFSG